MGSGTLPSDNPHWTYLKKVGPPFAAKPCPDIYLNLDLHFSPFEKSRHARRDDRLGLTKLPVILREAHVGYTIVLASGVVPNVLLPNPCHAIKTIFILIIPHVISHDPPAQASSPCKLVPSSVSSTSERSICVKWVNISSYWALSMSSNGA